MKTRTKPRQQQQLPFDTKEEAIQVVTKKIGMSRLKELTQGYQDGTTSKEEIIQEVSSKLTARGNTSIKNYCL